MHAFLSSKPTGISAVCHHYDDNCASSCVPHAVQAYCRQLAGHKSNEAASERIYQCWQIHGVSQAAAWGFVTMKPCREVRTMLRFLLWPSVYRPSVLRRVAAMTPLIIRVCATEGGLATQPLGSVCQNNAACSSLLGFLLGFLDSTSEASPGPG